MPLPTQTPSPSATALPEPIVFESEKYGFRIERPNESWRITTEPEELRSLNEDAVVAFESPEGVFSMVILEHLPQVSLDEYVSAVSPDLENVELLSDEKGTLTGFPARKRVFVEHTTIFHSAFFTPSWPRVRTGCRSYPGALNQP
ncbi:MAG: hypothetical protein UZ16_OP3001002979 [Candidatus Hinthialibacteria bacterium OLB16]|nr:MAG: hypothetical protein UZ16_OP3001002979 [Candidatus Hinthialibacteria bacterium OLB16]